MQDDPIQHCSGVPSDSQEKRSLKHRGQPLIPCPGEQPPCTVLPHTHMPCPSAMGSPSVPTASGLLQGLPHGREESSGKPENILEHLTPQISLHPELRAGQGDCEPHPCVTISSRESRGAKPALCKASREETALRGPTASPTHLPSTLFYLIMSTGWEFHERSFKPYSQDLSKLLVLEIRSGFGGQRHSFVPFGTWVLHQPTWKPELIPGQ